MSEHSYKNPPQGLDKNKKICVIGAGPGGLSAAYYLALQGYSESDIENHVGYIIVGRSHMVFRRGQKVEIFRKSEDESWESYMDDYIGLHGIITDPDASINDPDDTTADDPVNRGNSLRNRPRA